VKALGGAGEVGSGVAVPRGAGAGGDAGRVILTNESPLGVCLL
jgi:hypothetical protein